MILIILMACLSLLALGWYIYVSSLACAFGAGAYGRACSIPMPWEMGTEDFIFIALPLLVSLILLGIAVKRYLGLKHTN